MSKTIETLRRFPSKESALDDHIANTYFYQKRHKKKTKSYPPGIKINYAVASSFLFAFCIVAAGPYMHRQYINSLKERIAGAKVINIVDSGKPNSLAIKKFAFRGYARTASRFTDKHVILNNPKRYNWADASVDFKFPVDLSNRYISISLKGNRGGERLTIVLRDAANKSSRLNDIYLTSEWRTERLSLGGIKSDIDLSSITHIRMEYDSVGESAKDSDLPIDVTIYVKDFSIPKEG